MTLACQTQFDEKSRDCPPTGYLDRSIRISEVNSHRDGCGEEQWINSRRIRER